MPTKAYFTAVKSDRLGGRFIRWWTGKKWDHIALITDEQVIYEISYLGQIRFHSYSEYTKNASLFIHFGVELDWNICHAWMLKNKDIGYDWLRTLTWPLRRWFNFNDPKTINCVEFGELLCREHSFTITDGYQMEAEAFITTLMKRGKSVPYLA